MRENRSYGSAGGGDRDDRPFLPLSRLARPPSWIPAFAGMTEQGSLSTVSFAGVTNVSCPVVGGCLYFLREF